MKTISVSRKGVKSKPVSLSKAAKYLAKFVESDSGASEANLGFLKRASAAFNELNAFHKDIKKCKSRRADTDENGSEVIVDDGKKKKKKNDREVQEDGVLVDGRKRKKLDDGEEGRFEDADERKLKKRRKKNSQLQE